MRVALCYHGISSGKNFKEGGLAVAFESEFDSIQRFLIKSNPNCDFDIYLHSWVNSNQNEVIQKLRPVDYLFENTINFNKPTMLFKFKQLVKKKLNKPYFESNRINNIYSRWYSFQKVCELVSKNKQKYDLIFVTRFDMVLRDSISLKNISPEYFYSGDWETLYNGKIELKETDYTKVITQNVERHKKGFPYDEEGLQDFFFIGSPTYILKDFSKIYFNLKFLIKKYGASNHLIALGKLKEDNKINIHKRVYLYFQEYFLSRWL
ncbi:hypothetical protein [Maribacter litoralis]|uniref:hypothetical protein n=1 Tax=Maribacter litoralis TaxID=2059726 RepID=UPI003D296E72